jgi:hypothetical protein
MPNDSWTTRGSLSQIARTITAFDLTDVKRSYCKRQGVSAKVADLHERELKRYLTLCATNPQIAYGMFSPTDDLWHEFICFTQKSTHSARRPQDDSSITCRLARMRTWEAMPGSNVRTRSVTTSCSLGRWIPRCGRRE